MKNKPNPIWGRRFEIIKQAIHWNKLGSLQPEQFVRFYFPERNNQSYLFYIPTAIAQIFFWSFISCTHIADLLEYITYDLTYDDPVIHVNMA